MKFAPVILFAYNRPNHIKRTINSLLKNKGASQSDFFVFSDAPRREEDKLKVDQVREYLRTVNQFKSVTIIEREFNYGLGKNIIDGVTGILANYGKVIVLEDDLIASPYFLEYMNEGLDMYENDYNVISIHGYVYPVKENYLKLFL
jgi:GT2 family glycosyltransferase